MGGDEMNPGIEASQQGSACVRVHSSHKQSHSRLRVHRAHGQEEEEV